eukprot:g604.t1
MTNSSSHKHQFGTNNEWAIDELMVVFIIIFLITILAQQVVTHRWKLTFIGDAGTAMLTGLVCGGFFEIIKGKTSESINDNVLSFSPTVFFCVLLPPIIFSSGYHMKASWFFNNVWKVLALAFIGTFLSSFIIGGFLNLFGMAGASADLSLAECLAFGALISATDPVTTLAIFERLKVDPHLFYIIFGESVLNDAVAIVLFHTFEKFIGYSSNSDTILLAFADFIFIFAGSTSIGFGLGCMSSLLFKHIDLRNQPLLQLSVFILFCYLPFVLGEMCYMSGIVAILFTGLTMKHYTYNNLSDEVKSMSNMIVKLFAALAETVVFIDLGTSVYTFTHANAGMVIWSILLCLVARAIHVYPLSWLLNERKNMCNMRNIREIKTNEMHMVAFSGLRGAIAYALSVNFPGENAKYVRSTTTIVVMLSVFVLGGATEPMLQYLQIKMGLKRQPKLDVNSLGTPFVHRLLSREDGEWEDVSPRNADADEHEDGGASKMSSINNDTAAIRSSSNTPPRGGGSLRPRINSEDEQTMEDLVPKIQLAMSCTCFLNLDRLYLKPFLIREDCLPGARNMPRRHSHAFNVNSSSSESKAPGFGSSAEVAPRRSEGHSLTKFAGPRRPSDGHVADDAFELSGAGVEI